MCVPCASIGRQGFVLAAVAISLADAVSLRASASGLGAPGDAFKDYVARYRRSYNESSGEYERRGVLFHRRLALIEAQNRRPGKLWTAGVSHFTDRTDEELAQLRGWRRVAHKGGGNHGVAALLSEKAEAVAAPVPEMDWSHLSMAQEVPDQGSCGSCWAVAAASMLEGRFEATRKGNRSFSVQQLVNCVPNPKECGGSGGCDGATVELAMEYVMSAGLEDTLSQPYSGTQNECIAGASESLLSVSTQHGKTKTRRHEYEGFDGARLTVHKWSKLPENRALPLMHALATGPVAISVAASEWFTYDRGIFDGCGKDSVIDHAVVLFGYGNSHGNKYWKIRNSWGKEWGESGYIRLLRHDTPEADEKYCGTDNDPKSGVACKPYPDAVTVCGMCGLLYDSVAATFAVL